MPRMLGKLAFAVFTLALLPAFAAAPLAAAIDPDLLAGMKVRSVGPAGMSGRVADVVAVESDPATVYVGAATGGVWKSTNGGTTFEPVFDDQPVSAIGSLAVYQANPEVVWAGTGEGNVRNSASVGNGIYRSLDAGKTWTHLGLEKSERIPRIVLHPSDPEVAWVAALGREWGENPERGVYKTADGGKTWKRVLYVDEKTGAADLAIDPANPNKLYAAMWQFRRWPWLFRSGGPGSGLYVSEDGGATWKRRTEDDGLPAGDLGRIGLAVSRSNPQIVYAAVEAKKSAIVRSDDGGKSWRKVNERYDAVPRPFYFADLRVDPVWPNRIYSLDYDFRVSNDGGATFESLLGPTIHGDYHAMWIDPRDPDHLWLGNDGGVAESHDRGQTARFVANLPLAQYYHLSYDMERPYNLYGGLQDNGSWRGPSSVWRDGGIRNYDWQILGGGDGFAVEPDPEDSSTGYSMSQQGYLYRWNGKTGEIKELRPPAPAPGPELRFNWNSGLALDPFAPGTLYYGSQFLHKSTDRGASWTVISPDLTTNRPEWQKANESGGLTLDASGAENHTTIIAIAPSPVERGLLWVGTDDGRIQVTRDGGKTWTSVEKNVPGVPANTWVPHLRASPHAAGTAFAVFDDHRRSNWTTYAYRTDDYGKSWKSLLPEGKPVEAGGAGKWDQSQPQPRGWALAIEQDPVDPDLLFLGTEFGLWFSTDAGRSWTRFKAGLPTAPVTEVLVHPRDHDLLIATHGRALYVLDDVRPLRGLTAAALAEPLRLLAASDAQQYWSAPPPGGGFALGATEFAGDSRPYGAILTYALADPKLPLQDEEKERERKEKERQAKRQAQARAERSENPRGERPEGPAGEERPAGQPKPPVPGEEPAAGKEPAAKKEEEKKEDEKPAKVEIRVTDAAGKVVRTFEADAKQGVNRAVWDLRRDGFRQFPREKEPEEKPTGPEIVPGTYKVTLAYGGKEASADVRVLPDPRSRNTPADWASREAAIVRAAALQDLIAEAVDRVRKARSDVEAIEAKLATAPGGGGDKTGKDPQREALGKAAGQLKEGLDKLERRLWPSFEVVGIPPPTDALQRVSFPLYSVASTWSPPSPADLEHLKAAEAVAGQTAEEVNRFFAGEVAAFRRQVEAAKIELLPELPALAVPAAVSPP